MKQKVHVVYIITKLELGGAQKVCLSLLKGLKQSNHTSLLISGNEGPLVKEAQKYTNVILIDSFLREISIKTIFKELRTFFRLVKELRTLKKQYPELIVHTHSTKAGLLGRWAAFFAGVKKRVHTIHGHAFNNFQPKPIWFAIYFLELITSLITTHFICVSQKDAAIGTKLFPRFAKKHSIIHAAVEWDAFYQPARHIKERFISRAILPAKKVSDPIPFIFGTVACFKKQKNLFDLLNAFNEVHKKQGHPQTSFEQAPLVQAPLEQTSFEQTSPIFTKLELIGDGVLRPQIESWIQEHNLENAITLHGWQSSIAPIVKQWNAFVLTSLWEGLPCAVVEARLLGIPVISYKTGGIPEIIYHNQNGLLYEQKDVAGIIEGMRTLIENPKLYRRMCTFNDTLETFKNKVMVENHVSLYKNL